MKGPKRQINPARLGGYSRAQTNKSSTKETDPARQKIVAIVAMRTTDPVAWEKACKSYVLENEGLAVRFAQEWSGENAPNKEIINSAMVGLLEAIQRFDTTKAGRFSSFAVWRMLHACQTLVSGATITSVGRDDRIDRRELEAAEERLRAQDKPYADQDLLEELQREELRLAEKAVKRGARPRQPRWTAPDFEARFWNAKVPITGGYSEIDLELAGCEDVNQMDASIDIGLAMQKLSPLLRAVVSYEYDLGPATDYPVPTDPILRKSLARLAVLKLRALLDVKNDRRVARAKMIVAGMAFSFMCERCDFPKEECFCHEVH